MRRQAVFFTTARGAAAATALLVGHCMIVAAAPTGSAGAPGPDVVVAPLTVDLRDGHYAEVSLVLHRPRPTISDVQSELDPAQALDLAIAHLSHRTRVDLSSASARSRVEAELSTAITAAYGQRVTGVEFAQLAVQ